MGQVGSRLLPRNHFIKMRGSRARERAITIPGICDDQKVCRLLLNEVEKGPIQVTRMELEWGS
jgi:hypothetical protein